jgi:hypothetical protein
MKAGLIALMLLSSIVQIMPSASESWENTGTSLSEASAMRIPITVRRVPYQNSTNTTRYRPVNKYLMQRHLEEEDVSDDGGLSPIPPLHLSNYYNNEYVGTLGVGFPVQYLTVIFDTGSSDIWFPSKKCTTCGKHNLYDSSKSSTYNKKPDGTTSAHIDKPFVISYGSGEVSGVIALETLQLSTFSVSSVLIGEVTSESSVIAGFDMDGLCGLAFDGLSMVSRPGLLDSLQHSYPNLSHSFSFYLNTDPTDISYPSMIIFGGYDLSLVGDKAKFFYTPVVRDTPGETYWTVSLTSFQVALASTFKSIDDLLIRHSVCENG